jgi:hypothetical protein
MTFVRGSHPHFILCLSCVQSTRTLVSIPSFVYRFLLLWYSRSIFASLLPKSRFGISLCASQAVWSDPVKSRSKVDFCCRCFTYSSISVMHYRFSLGFLSLLTCTLSPCARRTSIHFSCARDFSVCAWAPGGFCSFLRLGSRPLVSRFCCLFTVFLS